MQSPRVATNISEMSTDDISSLKREIKRISNKRDVVIASRLSGDQQDFNLRTFEKELIRSEAELSRIRLLQSKVIYRGNETRMLIAMLIFIIIFLIQGFYWKNIKYFGGWWKYDVARFAQK